MDGIHYCLYIPDLPETILFSALQEQFEGLAMGSGRALTLEDFEAQIQPV